MKDRRALIPNDHSPLSRQIVPHVLRLLDPNVYSVILLRVAEPVSGLVGAPPRLVSLGLSGMIYEYEQDLAYAEHPIYADQVEASERDALEQTMREEQRRLAAAGYDVAVEVRFGDPAQEIVACAAEHGVDLIAMATHGRSGWRRLALGSVAEQVLRTAHVPMLLVRPFGNDEPRR